MDIDINFNFYSDTPKGKDPDSYSETLRKLSLNQAAILSTLQAVSSQNDDIKKRFEEQQDKISFP